MPLFVVEYTYSAVTDAGRDDHRTAHRDWLADLVEQKTVIVSGPYADDSGAFIVVAADTAEIVEGLFTHDPFVAHGLVPPTGSSNGHRSWARSATNRLAQRYHPTVGTALRPAGAATVTPDRQHPQAMNPLHRANTTGAENPPGRERHSPVGRHLRLLAQPRRPRQRSGRLADHILRDHNQLDRRCGTYPRSDADERRPGELGGLARPDPTNTDVDHARSLMAPPATKATVLSDHQERDRPR